MEDRQDPASTTQQDDTPLPPPPPPLLPPSLQHSHADTLSENETQRLHRLVIPMILDILRSRGEHNRHTPARTQNSLWNGIDGAHNDEDEDGLPDLVENNESAASTPESMDIDEEHRTPASDSEGDSAMMTDQQGQILPSPGAPALMEEESPFSPSSLVASPSPSSSPSATRRPRYRLVVYFEERELNEAAAAAGENAESPSSSPSSEEGGGERETDGDTADSEPSFLRAHRHREREGHPHRPSRYVAIFSIDSDAQNMPIIHSAGLHSSPASFEDIINQLFTSYMPKGTPPAKKEIIDSLPTTTFSQESCAAQPKCAVCLEEFAEGAEVVVLPCSHRFHGEDCVKPWLRMHSSCPICRYEMPVDDAEYEEKRKERMAKRGVPSDPVEGQQQEVTFDDPVTVNTTPCE